MLVLTWVSVQEYNFNCLALLGGQGMRSLKTVFVSLLSFGIIFLFTPTTHGQDSGSQDKDQHISKKEQKKKEKELMKELGNPYKEWLSEVSYIITPDERKTFLSLQTNEEREQFIEAFWARRNPDPGSPVNTFKE